MATVIGLVEDNLITAKDWNSARVHHTNRCPRCGGLMVHEWGADPMENAGQRCVQCGELVDSVILENRRLQQKAAFSLASK
ncbi:MAG TPA: hypothetical protein VJU54_03670 [Nitrospiraceae bacterium]|nr:hypothetical protein [Nitrospiraceae bacterium]